MSEPIEVEATPVYWHDCRALGPHTRLPRALMADSTGEYVLYWQHKCPFCSQTAGDKVYATGVKPLPGGGYEVNTVIAERLHSSEE